MKQFSASLLFRQKLETEKLLRHNNNVFAFKHDVGTNAVLQFLDVYRNHLLRPITTVAKDMDIFLFCKA